MCQLLFEWLSNHQALFLDLYVGCSKLQMSSYVERRGPFLARPGPSLERLGCLPKAFLTLLTLVKKLSLEFPIQNDGIQNCLQLMICRKIDEKKCQRHGNSTTTNDDDVDNELQQPPFHLFLPPESQYGQDHLWA